MGHEGSAKDKREDQALAKQHGMSMKEWEASAADKAHDAPAPTNATHRFPSPRNGHGYGHNAVQRSHCGLRLSGHPGAHQIGRKK